jgi:transposase-like protein
MKDHIYIFKVYCSCCKKPNINKIFLSLFVEPEIVWRTYLLLSGRSSYTCKDCTLDFMKRVGANL